VIFVPILIFSTPLVAIEIVSAIGDDKPVLVPPVKFKVGNVKVPVIESPLFRTFNDDPPVILPVTFPTRFPVIVPAEILPEPSRNTSVFGVLALVPVVAVFATLPAVEIVANLVSAIAADDDTSAFTTRELDNNPDALL